MATAAEIERLVVKLVADASEYDAGLRKAEADTTAAVRRIEAAASDAIDDHAAAMREAAAIAQAVATPTERYAQEVAKLNQLHLAGYLDFDQYLRAMDQAKLKLPETQQAIARYKNEQEAATKATHEATMAVKAAAMARLREKEAAEAAAKAQGKAVYDATRTSAERYAVKLRELNALHKSGHISADTHRRAIKQLGAEYSTTAARVQGLTNGLRSAQTGFLMTGASLSLSVTAPILAAGAAAVKFGSDIDTAFAGLRKTVDASSDELEAIKAQMEGMIEGGTPFDLTELLGIGEQAGQLGIKTENIVDFTKTIADLQVTTNLGEQAATTMARIANVSGMAQTQFSNLGSTIVALGNSTATTEAEIAEMMLRLSGAGKTVGMHVSQTAALSAALSSVGIEAEAGGTAFSQLFIKMSKAIAHGGEELTDFASVAGMSGAEFQKAFKDDAAGAVVALLKQLKTLEGSDAFLALEKMGIDGIRETDALLRMSGAVNIVEDAMNTASEAFGENIALAKEAQVRYDSFASQVKNLWAQIKILGADIHEILAPYILYVVDAVKQGVQWFRGLSKEVKTAAIVIAGIAAAVGPVLVMFGLFLGVVISIIGAVTTLGFVGTAAAAGIGVWAAQVAVFLGVLGSLVAYVMGTDGLTAAWNKASSAVSSFVTKAIGFVANLRTNIGILISWFRENWSTLMFDAIELVKVFVVNMVTNMMTMIKTAGRLWQVWQGYMAGVFMNLFTVDFVNAVLEGIKIVGRLLWEFATFQADILARILTGTASQADFGAFFDQMSKDFKKGMETQDLAGSMRDVIRDGMGELKNPLEGFVSKAGGPDFVYDFAKENIGEPAGQGIADGITEATRGAGEGVKGELTELQKTIQEYSKTLHEQIATQGMSSRELEVWKLRMEGATDAELRGVIAMSRHLDLIEKQNAAIEAGKSIIEEFKTPQEKFRDRMSELTQHLRDGTIDMTTFHRATKAAKDTLSGGINVEFKVSGIDAVASGSAEALARFEEFRATAGAAGSVRMREQSEMRLAMQQARSVGPAASGPVLAGPVGPADGRRPAGSGPGQMTPYEIRSLELLDQIAMGLGRGRRPGQRVVMPANLQGEQT